MPFDFTWFSAVFPDQYRLGSCRADRILNNVHLLYALMHEFVPLEAAFAHTAVAAALAEQEIPAAIPAAVVSVVRHYLKVVETAIGEANTSKYSAAQVRCVCHCQSPFSTPVL